MDEFFFRTECLSVGYAGVPLIKEIEMGVKKGEILTLIGPNGSGKSTILKSITKHLETLGGTVFLERLELEKLSNKDLSKKLSVVLTDRIRPELMTCGEVVEAGRYPYTNYFGKLTDEDLAIVRESLAKVHASELAECPFSEISDGQRQRVMLARAICQQPEVIVLDEPTSFLDIRHKMELLNILRTMAKQQNIAVVMSLHEIDLAAKVSDKIMCVKGETIPAFGTPEEIFREGLIDELYGIEKGSYNLTFGSVELERPEGLPRVFVVAGCGTGVPFFRRLQKRNVPFAAGILFENDVDFQVAEALASETFSESAFTPISEELFLRARARMRTCEYVLDAGCPSGEFNRANRRLLDDAMSAGIPVLTDLPEQAEVDLPKREEVVPSRISSGLIREEQS